jgi:hypothetical protein
MEQLDLIINAVNKLDQSAGSAQKYGPFFFALLLLILGPLLCRMVFSKSLGDGKHSAKDPEYQDFRFYFRSTIVVGLLCVMAGVGWFFFENFRQVEQTKGLIGELKSKVLSLEQEEKAKLAALEDEMKKKVGDLEDELKGKYYTFAGLISSGIEPNDEFFHTTVGSQLSIIFTRVPQSRNIWFFAVISENQVPSPYDLFVGWSQRSETGEPPQSVNNIPLQVKLAQKKFSNYRFSLAGDTATLEPLER